MAAPHRAPVAARTERTSSSTSSRKNAGTTFGSAPLQQGEVRLEQQAGSVPRSQAVHCGAGSTHEAGDVEPATAPVGHHERGVHQCLCLERPPPRLPRRLSLSATPITR